MVLHPAVHLALQAVAAVVLHPAVRLAVVGYSDIYQFSRAFKRFYKISPDKFRVHERECNFGP